MKELSLKASIDNIERVTDFINAELEALDCPIKVEFQIDVAIDELFGNIARYAYGDEEGSAVVSFEVEENPLCAVISFIDSGEPFNPLMKDEPDVSAPLAQRQEGGLGIFLVKKTMDAVEYEYKDGKNILTIKKNLE